MLKLEDTVPRDLKWFNFMHVSIVKHAMRPFFKNFAVFPIVCPGGEFELQSIIRVYVPRHFKVRLF